MSHDAAAKAIETRFNTEWAGRTPIRWENVPWVEPDPPIPWVALFYRPVSSMPFAGGQESQTRRRFVGVVTVQVFVPEQTGTRLALSYAGQVEDIWYRSAFGDAASGIIRCWDINTTHVGVENAWEQFNVDAEFIRDLIA